ncbi:Acetyl-coenzyme A carboxyl transferase beta chain [hydrothermal vent metagenome]|uniref:Acetyl-coenzyme A carboxyl transferase beta chain n=1 Tax=hydrothermal vent metagenome TaxID=652676 RepID=A0A3B0R2Y0_9ZZZZ
MAWFKKNLFKKDMFKNVSEQKKSVKVPHGMWVKCNHCNEIIYKKEVERNLEVCPKCNYHFRISAKKRIETIIDEGTFVEYDSGLEAVDALEFKDLKKYKDRLKDAHKKKRGRDAIVTGCGLIDDRKVMLGVFEFAFMGGSMGSVVGEKITRILEAALTERAPVIIFTSSGGARMQEGILSLMQMAKTSAAIARLNQAGVPYISVLTDPTTGGVTASFAMLGDLIIAEPKALIGFAGPRVIQETIKQKLPEGFQRSEFLLEHGMLDMIVERKLMKETLSMLVSHFS